jgi:hypothetical protein
VFWLARWKVRLGLVGRFRAFGSSTEPVIPSGSRVSIAPVDVERIELGDIVVARVRDYTMLHLVKAIDADRPQVEISGTSGPANSWTAFDFVYGSVLASVRRRSREPARNGSGSGLCIRRPRRTKPYWG